MTEPSFLIHAGLPRTGTTSLQKLVFPRLAQVDYIGKNSDNKRLPAAQYELVPFVRERAAGFAAGREDAVAEIRSLMTSLLVLLRLANYREQREQREALRALFATLYELRKELKNPILLSDESILESGRGAGPHLQRGDKVPLEQFARGGLLQHAHVSVVLRDPLQFLSASYYKLMEQADAYTTGPMSFRTYMEGQMRVYEDKPSASRIFWSMHNTARAHLRKLCPRLTVCLFSELVKSEDVMATLFEMPQDVQRFRYADLPRENSSWRNPKTNAFLLSAPDVPRGLTIEQYVATFPQTLEELGLARVLATEAMTPSVKS